MKPNIRPISSVRRALWCAAAVLSAASGCSEVMNPFVDDVPATSEVTTASVYHVRHAGAAPVTRERGFTPAYASAQDGTVAHWPIWWEDPFVDKGSQDGQFAWTGEDYFAIPYGCGRHLLNTMGMPVSAVVTPPWTVMGSDGVLSRQALGYDHDATRLPGGMPPPTDVLEVGSVPPEMTTPSTAQPPEPGHAE